MIRRIDPVPETANERLKRAFGRWLWASLMLAVMFHFGVFQLFPRLTAAAPGGSPDPPVLVPPLKPDIPPPPPEIDRPRPPVPARVELDEIETMHPTTLDQNPVERLRPPGNEGLAPDATRVVPYTVAPRLRDPDAALRTLERHYPPILKAAGVSGEVVIRAYVDTTGRVLDVEIVRSSGVEALDQAARHAVASFEFTPALNMDRRVAVWIQQLIAFEIK